ncbi:MAG TPA: aminotransferase class V-fold PLP-dependent enzyme [Actinomycetota bacterium]|nr:aminotransferase class V-fold PLP-dependent enzyme [Actinomycetota bacterium]
MQSQRSLFDIPGDVTYLNAAYLGPRLKSVDAAGRRALERTARPWEIFPEDFFSDAEVARDRFAALVGGDADGVALVPAVSYGIALAAKNVPIPRGKNVVVLDEQFPSNVYEWRDAAARAGGSLVTVPRPPDHDWTREVLERIDDRTAVVAVPNCHWTDGTVVDLARVGEAARSAGAALVVDATQSLGVRPLDVRVVQPDWLVVAGYKWMLGPFTLGYCWVAPHRREGEPLERNWLTRAGAEDFTGLVRYTDDFAPGARRYDMGERPNFHVLPMGIAALEQLLDWGVRSSEEYIGTLTDALAEGAESLGWDVAPRAARSRHMLGLRRPDGIPEKLPALLKDANVYVSVRGTSIRVSPHVYNSPADVARLLEVLDAV